jgi:thioredoxin reductase (NADPH)
MGQEDDITLSQVPARDNTLYDLLVIGSGPTGMACAIEAQRRGFSALLVDKGCLCNSLFHYPEHMTFFTTPELLEIGDMPFSTPNQKPTRAEALEYYRKVAEHYSLNVRPYETVERVSGHDGQFAVHTADRFGRPLQHRARKLVLATGYYDLPNKLGVPGEELSKVQHYYDDPHPYFGLDVAVIGGKNSAAIAALDLWRHGARVTLVHRGPRCTSTSSTGSCPTSTTASSGEITACFSSTVTRITEDEVTWPLQPARSPSPTTSSSRSPATTPTSASWRSSASASTRPTTAAPSAIPATLESNVPGIYLAGVIIAGRRTNEIFIENGRFHGKLIAEDLQLKLPHPR